MNPKEKAKELIGKFRKYSKINSSGFLVSNEDTSIESAKQCALICVDELIEEHTYKNHISWNIVRKRYWEDVKNEIEKL